jgi:hypothetical protein
MIVKRHLRHLVAATALAAAALVGPLAMHASAITTCTHLGTLSNGQQSYGCFDDVTGDIFLLNLG